MRVDKNVQSRQKSAIPIKFFFNEPDSNVAKEAS